MISRLFILLTSVALFLTSCTKEDKQPSNVEMLTTATWKVVSAYEILSTANSNDTANAVKVNCSTGGSFKLMPDGSIESNLPVSNCMLIEENMEYQWQFNEDEPFLTIRNSSGEATFSAQVTQLTNSTLVLVGNAGRNNDSAIVFRYYYLEAL